MLARLYIATPFVMIVPDNTAFTGYTYEDEGYSVTAKPPGRSDMPIYGDVPDRIEVDGAAAFAANALQIDFQKDAFNRAKDGPIDPSEDVLRRAVVRLLARLRYVTRGARVTPPTFPQSSWRLRYLHDDGSELQEDTNLVRGYGGRAWSLSFVGVSPTIWDDIHSLAPDWTPPPWDDILLDATATLPKVGTAVVLAATALEVFIADVLDRVAARGDVPADLWYWINHRGDWQRDPSTEEQFDVLLKHFVGHSLKEENRLWQAFQHLRTARNKFVHEGRAAVGGKKLSTTDATRLIANAHEIVAWIRQWLPADLQWPQFDHKLALNFEFQLR